ncbi:cAMP-dependent protein kinase catalytic subunit beta-like [Homalodisca vitripennis]|uniref:cAMP-dependent protein kinase catalytic subunit beta-like n=1 Tax=Homalodisca vitripennis TaxID=197043 RepID=UPI001EEB7B1C|nr:cAMP-dependent protein kinase catalytic subunit beta-like [Homalodisca vitripennis]
MKVMPLEETYNRRLPLYGALKIDSVEVFLEESKQTFEEMYNSVFPYVLELSNFKFHYLLGEGAFARVVLAEYKEFEGSFYAVKAISKRSLIKTNQVKTALNEKRILQSLNHPFVIRLEYFSKDQSFIYFVLPFICGGEMFTHLKIWQKFEENVARFYAAQVVLGMEYLHNLDLVFRDLKPENLLIDHYGYLKITDFGFTKKVLKRTYTFCGTPDYIAPEIISGKGYSKAVDWWALGVLIFEMAGGHPPFVSLDQMKKFTKIIKCQYLFPKEFGDEMKDLISKLLETDVTKRFGNLKRGVEDIKLHEWFKELNWLKLLNRRVASPYVPKDAETVSSTYFPHMKPKTSWKISAQDRFSKEFEDF